MHFSSSFDPRENLLSSSSCCSFQLFKSCSRNHASLGARLKSQRTDISLCTNDWQSMNVPRVSRAHPACPKLRTTLLLLIARLHVEKKETAPTSRETGKSREIDVRFVRTVESYSLVSIAAASPL